MSGRLDSGGAGGGSGGGIDPRDYIEGSGTGYPRIRFTALLFTIASSFILFWAGLLSATISGVIRAVETVYTVIAETLILVPLRLIQANMQLVAESFGISAAALVDEFGVFAYVAGVVIIAVWFLMLEAVVSFVRGWISV